MSDRPLRIVSEQRGEIIEPGKVSAGWGWPKRKLDTAGHAKSEIARLYKRCAKGEMSPDDLGKAVWALVQFTKVAEAAEAEARLDALERALAEVSRRGR
jgi:hypothetical protein